MSELRQPVAWVREYRNGEREVYLHQPHFAVPAWGVHPPGIGGCTITPLYALDGQATPDPRDEVAAASTAGSAEDRRESPETDTLLPALDTFLQQVRNIVRDSERKVAEIERLRRRKDGAYEERNRVVAAFAACALMLGWRAGVTSTAIEGWSEDWHGCVYIETPEGQVSWHFHDSQAHLFTHLPPYEGVWDGHETPEKYERLVRLTTRTSGDGSTPSALRDAARDLFEVGAISESATREFDEACAPATRRQMDDTGEVQ